MFLSPATIAQPWGPGTFGRPYCHRGLDHRYASRNNHVAETRYLIHHGLDKLFRKTELLSRQNTLKLVKHGRRHSQPDLSPYRLEKNLPGIATEEKRRYHDVGVDDDPAHHFVLFLR